MAGLAIGVKYTSFTTPLVSSLLIIFWRRKNFKQTIGHAAHFSLVALIIAASWYVRNTVIMGNPFHPFVFDGRYWDSFLTNWYNTQASAGTCLRSSNCQSLSCWATRIKPTLTGAWDRFS